MNLFVIPSWYPHRCHPLEGIFVLEQAAALGELRPDWTIAISRWGQGLGRISLGHARRSPRCLIDALRLRGSFERNVRDNVVEFMTFAPSWGEGFLHGNRRGILEANRRNLRRSITRFGSIDLLHAHVSYPAGWVAMEMSAELGIPYVVTEHMGPFPLKVYEHPDGSLPSFIRNPLERADARVAVSPALAERIASFGIPMPEVVPNVVDERLYSIEVPDPKAPFTFFTLGGMDPVKGFPDLLDAIARLVERLPDQDRARVRFRLGGDGPYRKAYEQQCRSLGLDPWVAWLGFLSREQARHEFHRCNCYVLASHHESFGVVLVEAMAAGKPVIATRCGGPDSIVTPANGILVDVGRPPELAEAMHAVCTGQKRYDPGLIRDGFLRQFSRAAVVDRLEGIYRRTLARGGPRRVPTVPDRDP
ncbi:MAG TPA: glycosyltransferase [Candidatus Eisenbacteria bacterium]